MPRGGQAIAEVHAGWLRLRVVTRYRARTAVERWQFQDRLRLRVLQVAPRGRPQFYETAAGELAFSLWGWRSDADLLEHLRRVDRDDADWGD